jgi:hypothetical protein
MRNKLVLSILVVIAILAGVIWRFLPAELQSKSLGSVDVQTRAVSLDADKTSDIRQSDGVSGTAADKREERIAATADKSAATASPSPRTVDLRRLARGDLAAAYEYGMNSTEKGSGTLAVYTITACLNYLGSKEPVLPSLPPTYVELLSKTGASNIDDLRKTSAAKLKQLCAGFDKSTFADFAAAAHKKSLGEGFGFLKYQTSSEPSTSFVAYEAALKTLLEWPERYAQVLSVNTAWLGDALVGRSESRLTPTESMFASQLVLCGLGADCSPDSVQSLEYCAMTGSCNGTLVERVHVAASASGIDLEKLKQTSHEFVADFRRADRNKLRL